MIDWGREGAGLGTDESEPGEGWSAGVFVGSSSSAVRMNCVWSTNQQQARKINSYLVFSCSTHVVHFPV